jgi:hypothetical protein
MAEASNSQLNRLTMIAGSGAFIDIGFSGGANNLFAERQI